MNKKSSTFIYTYIIKTCIGSRYNNARTIPLFVISLCANHNNSACFDWEMSKGNGSQKGTHLIRADTNVPMGASSKLKDSFKKFKIKERPQSQVEKQRDAFFQ